MDWKRIENVGQLEDLKKQSQDKPVLIFKHSSRCSISNMAFDRLNRNWKDTDFDKVSPYFLDLISFRDISDQIAREFGVYHQSPQVILIKNGQAVYDNSHMGISYGEIMGKVEG
ncbi:bacillithiol system redox-active protein YtxJ [Aquiflexum sp.]|uniref:bacillithiol system redox-active protein YtxJ n=1 Tax=Aquiflexum sp. TaxID=1872584 RepID=UPI0035931239